MKHRSVGPFRTHAHLSFGSRLLFASSLIVLVASKAPGGIDRRGSDHLVPPPFGFRLQSGPLAEYRKLCESKLFVSPTSVAQYVRLPGSSEREQALSVWCSESRQGRRCWITVTSPSARLWSCIPVGTEKTASAREIIVHRRDAQLPTRTADAVRGAWIAILSVQQVSQTDQSVGIDNDIDLFKVVNAKGKTLEGCLPLKPGPKTSALLRLAGLLADYCEGSEARRTEMAPIILRVALALQRKT
jgi:hypothetical protein